MTDDEIIKRIDTALAEEFELKPEAMVPGARLNDDLGLDSLDTVDLVLVLEHAFGFKVREGGEAIQRIRTLGDIHAFIIAKAQARQTS